MSWSETVALNKSKNKLRKVILSYTGEKYNETKLPNQHFFNSNMLYYDISWITGMLNTRQHSLNIFRVNFNKWNTDFAVIWDIGCTDIGNLHNTLTESWICILCFEKWEKLKPGCPKDLKTALKVQHKCTAIVSLNSPVLEFPKMTLWCL